MILADTSAWVDYFRRSESDAAAALDDALASSEVILGDLILAEVLQGVRSGPEDRLVRAAFRPIPIKTLCGPEIAYKAAENYRAMRRVGLTVRGTVDVVIATWCIENDVTLLHGDRCFTVMERELGLVGYH